MTSDRETFFIGELAERTGASRDTIRYYEDEGILPEPARAASGYRLYGPADVERLEFVGRAKTLGLTLGEIADVMEIVEDGRTPCVHVRERLDLRLRETRQRILRLRALERRLVATLSRVDEEAAGRQHDCRCPIIETSS